MIFQFKQFSVQQSDNAAKITTDATIFAAWLPVDSSATLALEIGAGTGVLSLMLAQRYQALALEAVEIQALAFEEAKVNFNNSDFSDRLTIHHSDIKDFNPLYSFDVVFSNPPFFKNNLKSDINEAKNTAYHTDNLSFELLAESIDRCLNPTGEAFVLLPYYESELLETLMLNGGFFVHKELLIKHNLAKPPLRRAVSYKRQETKSPHSETVIVRNADNDYSKEYKSLMTPFLTIF